MRGASLILLSILFVLLWSSGWIVSRFAVNDISVITLLTLRYFIVFACLLVLVIVSGQWKLIGSTNVSSHLLIGILSHATYLLAGVGAFELGATATLVAFVTALQPMTTAALSRFISPEPITLRQWQGLIIGFCAVLLLVSEGYNQGINTYALSLPFLAVLALSIGTLINRRIELNEKDRKRKPVPITVILFLHSAGALSILIPMCLRNGPVELNFGINQWLVIFWLALVVSLGAYAVLLLLLRHISALQVSSLSYLVPPATMAQAYLVFGDSIGTMDVAALFIAALGVFLVMRKPAHLQHTYVHKKGPDVAGP